jgi:HD-like signal output (HDOD) protein
MFITPMKNSQEQFRLAVDRIEKFSPAPAILARSLTLLRDPHSDIADIAKLVGSDPSITADLIRCANSVFYGSGEPNQTIGEAIQKIGSNETIRLLNLAVTRVVAKQHLGCYGISADDFWAESLFNGLFLRNLTSAAGRGDAEQAYTVGLLRFLGRLAINQAIEDHGGGLFWGGNEPISAWEQQSVGFVQAQAGATLLGKWKFSAEMIHAIGGQDDPASLPEPSWLAEALQFTSRLFPQGLGVQMQPAPVERALAEPACARFVAMCSLSAEQIQGIVETTFDDYSRTRRMIDPAV